MAREPGHPHVEHEIGPLRGAEQDAAAFRLVRLDRLAVERDHKQAMVPELQGEDPGGRRIDSRSRSRSPPRTAKLSVTRPLTVTVLPIRPAMPVSMRLPKSPPTLASGSSRQSPSTHGEVPVDRQRLALLDDSAP